VVVENAYRLAGPGFEPDGHWWLGVHTREEAARGLTAEEDLCCVGRFTAQLEPGGTMAVSAWAGDAASLATAPPPAAQVIASARARAREITATAADGTAAALALAADAFVVRGPSGTGPDVIAGYPWFGAWSRDTMISYEGLFLATGRAAEGRELLRGYAATLNEGMLANTADSGRAEYNTADATLWLLHAVDRHVVATGDDDLAAELVGALDEVIAAHLTGTRFGIRVDPADDLLRQGADGKALTWMDAVVNGQPVTARPGKPVEINALWVNGLAAVAGLRERLGRDASPLRAARDRAVESFRRRFASPAVGWLCDVVDSTGLQGHPRGEDLTLRPNQLLAFGLPYAPMRGTDPTRAAATVRTVGAALLTPLGPRSLATGEPAYQGRHRGDMLARDRAYHQGTVWPWLIGPYVDACLTTGVPVDGALDGLVAHLGEWGLGSVSETAEGEPPHAATGCPFQAWSVAEVNRAYGTAR
jgi:predicted glycogen debranching enzyme